MNILSLRPAACVLVATLVLAACGGDDDAPSATRSTTLGVVEGNDDSALLDEATIEHGSAKHLIAEIGAAQASDSLYDARVKVLGEYIRHHVKEEEGELFSACRKSEMDLAAIGARLGKRKAQLMRKLAGQ